MKSALYPVLAMVTLAASPLYAAAYTSTWQQTDPGDYLWSGNGNWNTASAPANGGSDTYDATIKLVSGSQTVTTGGALTLSRIHLDVAAGAALTLKLGGNMSIVNTGFTSTSFTNSTSNAPAALTIDLAGYNLAIAYGDLSPRGSANYTIASSNNAGGVYSLTQVFYSGTNLVTVKDNVTVKITGAGLIQDLRGWTFGKDTTLKVSAPSAASSAMLYLPTAAGTAVGNLIVGDSGDSLKTTSGTYTGSRILGNFTINSYTGATGGAASEFNFLNNSLTLYIGGNFYDAAFDASGYGNAAYTSNTFAFNGNTEAFQEITMRRTAIGTNIRVGESASITGRIRLMANLATSGNFRVLDGSIVDIGEHILSVGTLNSDDWAGWKITLSENAGHVSVMGNIVLRKFYLDLSEMDDTWVSGDDLLLFEWGGTYTGADEATLLRGIILPEDMTYGGIFLDEVNKQVWLQNIAVIPEPSTALLMTSGALGALALRRRSLKA